MKHAEPDVIELFRRALLSLRPTGPLGFEGLTGLVLGSISGIPFRLAGSGIQGGSDAVSSFAADHVAYECKRYDGALSRESVLSKLAELSKRQDVDVWVLAATTVVSAQLAGDVIDIADAQALEAVILDWDATTGLPLLGVACALVQDEVLSRFVDECELGAQERLQLAEGIACLRTDARFDDYARKVRQLLDSAQLSIEKMRARNIVWLRAALSDPGAARRAFGQPLAPAASAPVGVLPRPKIHERIRGHMCGKGDGSPLFVTGNEGVGKSWAVLQSWLSCTDPPALFYLAPDAFVGTPTEDPIDVLARAIGRQCGDADLLVETPRWRRKLRRWLSVSDANPVRFAVYFDGINQQQTVDWGRAIEDMDHDIRRAGGRIVVSSRRAYYDANIATRLMSSKPSTVPVPDWAEEERDGILRARGIDPSALSSSVLRSLLNPRLLGIATELLTSEAIEGLDELDVGRLLFEHLLASYRTGTSSMPAHKLVQRLSDHAKSLIERIESNQVDDVGVFDSIDAVVEEHYFHPLDEDPNRYTLSRDGIRLALALAILDRLQAAQRNGRDLVPTVQALTDPVSALDDTAGVLLAALSVSCADGKVHDDICTALIIAFAEAQNPNHEDLLPFVALASRRTDAFMAATRHLCLEELHGPNLGWVKLAVWRAAQSAETWPTLSKHVERWLVTHSLEPSRAIHPGREDNAEKVEAKLQEEKTKLAAAVQGLSDAERRLYSGISEIPANPMFLHRIALSLLAGKPLAPYAGAFATFALGSSLDPQPFKNNDDLNWLCWLNTVDWRDMHAGLLGQVELLTSQEASATGRWAVVALLRMTGASEDARRANEIVRSLRSVGASYSLGDGKWGWRFLDPSDPDAPAPDNLKECAQRMRDVSIKELFKHLGTGSDDHAFDETIPILARFQSETAVAKIRELAVDARSRNGMAFRQCIFALDKHGAVIGHDLAEACLKIREGDIQARCAGLPGDHADLLSNMCLSIAFPHVAGTRQLDALLANAPDKSLFLNLLPSFKAHEAGLPRIRQALAEATNCGNERAICYLLSFMHSIPMPGALEDAVLDLCRFASPRVRTYALALVLDRGTDRQLARILDGDWSAAKTDDDPEKRLGSLVLIRAAKRSGGDTAQVFHRVATEFAVRLATTSVDAARVLASLLDRNIRDAFEGRVMPPAVDVSFNRGIDNDDYGIHISTQSRRAEGSSQAQVMRHLGDNLESYETERRSNQDAYARFVSQLERARASFVLHPASVEEISAIAGAAPEYVTQWTETLLRLDKDRRPLCKNIALALSAHLSQAHPEQALQLIEGYIDVDDFVTFSYGQARLTMEHRAVWSPGTSPSLDEERKRRLDSAPDDHALALEVLAAEQWGHGALLDACVGNWILGAEPIRQARAIAICGFRNDARSWIPELESYRGATGLLAQAYRSAKGTFERNQWARHWYGSMCNAGTPVEFWRALVLLSKVVDHRADLWLTLPPGSTQWISIYANQVRNMTRNALNKVRSQRELKLFDLNKPNAEALLPYAPRGCHRNELQVIDI